MGSSDAYLEYARLLRRLHALIRLDDDHEEADAIRDEMDNLYLRLSRPEIERLELLSADLNSIRLEVPPGIARPSDEEISGRIQSVAHERDPEKIRQYLDADSKDSSRDAFVRFLYWARLRDFDSARPFAQFLLTDMEEDLAEIRASVLNDRENLENSIATSDEPVAPDLQQSREYLDKSIQELDRLLILFHRARSRIGLLDEVGEHEPSDSGSSRNPGELTDEVEQDFIALFSSLSSVLHAA